MFSVDTISKLKEIGTRLREARLARNEVQERFATRLGISVPTLRKMEKGDPTCSIGNWAEALHILDRLDDLDGFLEKKESLFEKRDKLKQPKRERASKRKT